MDYITGGVTSPKGFKAGAVAANVKYKDRLDMAAVFSDFPCVYAATFTKNVVKAAPVRWDMDILKKKESIYGVVVNSGYANAATGPEGMLDCVATAEHAGEVFHVPHDSVLVASTGVIGQRLPMEKIKSGIDALYENMSDSTEAGSSAAQAIMTTDTEKKEVAVSFMIGETEVTIGGMAKGSGMIHPNMGTMLSFITTDASISRELLQEALSDVVDSTYNMVSVDGDTSTNDTCVLLANGAADNDPITRRNEYYRDFRRALYMVNKRLAMLIAGDGEGATALVESRVINAASKEDARTLAKSVITSSLTKAAIFGHDANWGRIICALGYSGAEFDPDRVDISISGNKKTLELVRGGRAVDYSEEEASKILGAKRVIITSDMNAGDYDAKAWGCDLSYDYVKINADYRS